MSMTSMFKRSAKERRSRKTAALRRHIDAVAAGNETALKIDLADEDVDLAGLIQAVTPPEQAEGRERVVAALRKSGTFDTIVDQLGAQDVSRRARSARLVGALRVEHAVARLATMLSSREPSVRSAAARALGRIGGYHSAEALSRAILRRGASPSLVIDLTRSAPDLYLETVIAGPAAPRLRQAAALAAGLRRRRTAVGPLMALLASDDRGERIAGCRALGWLRAAGAAPVVSEGLDDSDWRMRMSAAKALANLDARAHLAELEERLADPNRRVRRAAYAAMRRQAVA